MFIAENVIILVLSWFNLIRFTSIRLFAFISISVASTPLFRNEVSSANKQQLSKKILLRRSLMYIFCEQQRSQNRLLWHPKFHLPPIRASTIAHYPLLTMAQVRFQERKMHTVIMQFFNQRYVIYTNQRLY